jgi:WD40 repeat protein
VSRVDGHVIAGGSDGSLTLWNAITATSARVQRAHANQVRGVAITPDGRRFASAGWDGFVRVWQTDGCAPIWEKQVGKDVFSVAFHPRDPIVAASYSRRGTSGYRIGLWNADTGEFLSELAGHETVIRRIRFSPDGSILASGDDAGILKVWDYATRTPRESVRAHPFMIFDLTFSEDGHRLVTASGEFFMHGETGEVKVWDTRHWEGITSIRTSTGAFFAVAMNKDGTRLATGGDDSAVRIWDAATGRETLTLRGHKDAVWGVEFSPNGRELFSASGDHDIRRWDARPLSGEESIDRNALTGHDGTVTALTFHPRDPVFVSGDMTGAVCIWDSNRRELIHRLPDLPGQVHSAMFNATGTKLAVATWRPWQARQHTGMVVVYDVKTWKEQARHHLDPVGILSVSFSPDGTLLAAACDFEVAVVRAETGQQVWRQKRQSLVTALGFLPNGSLATGDADGAIVLYGGATGSILRSLSGHAGRVTALAVSRNGRRFASVGMDGSTRAWDIATWQELRRPREHTGGIYAIALSHDGRHLISGGVALLKCWSGALLEFRLQAVFARKNKTA